MADVYIYFRAKDDPAVAALMAKLGEEPPVGRADVASSHEGVVALDIEPREGLGRLVATALGQKWTPELVSERLVWPPPPEDEAYEGPWVISLGALARNALAHTTPTQVAQFARRWADDEWLAAADDEDVTELEQDLSDIAALARHAADHGDELYCWIGF